MITVAPATDLDALTVGLLMRGSDEQELRALGHDPRVAPVEAVHVSDPDLCWALIDENGLTIAVCGAARLNDDVGVAWLLTAEGFGNHPRDIMNLSKALLAKMHERYPVLFNWIDERNVRSLQWLKYIGFFPTVTNPDYSGSGLPFTCYVSLRNV
jgi:hypothetical protein